MSTPSVFDINQTSLRAIACRPPTTSTCRCSTSRPEARRAQYMKMVNDYYNLVTDFTSSAGGSRSLRSALSRRVVRGFAGSPRAPSGAQAGAAARHDRARYRLWHPGPMRAIARFSGASVVGINNNAYQIERGRKQNIATNLAHLCSFQQADFMGLPFAEGSVDAAYAIEATCHAPDKTALFREILRTLKPGAQFAGYEWCLTDLYDGNNPEHRQLKLGVETGDALPELPHQRGAARP